MVGVTYGVVPVTGIYGMIGCAVSQQHPRHSDMHVNTRTPVQIRAWSAGGWVSVLQTMVEVRVLQFWKVHTEMAGSATECLNPCTLRVDEDDFGGHGELMGIGMGEASGCFMVRD